MKKIFIIAGVVGFTILALGVASLVFAQSVTPPPITNAGYGHGMMGGWGGQVGMQGGWTNGELEPNHVLMLEAFAARLGLSVDQIQTRLDSGESMWQIAESSGINVEDFGEMRLQAHWAMLNQGVENGTLTQEQAESMGWRWQADDFDSRNSNCPG